MTLEQVFKLIDAGYTKQDIMQFTHEADKDPATENVKTVQPDVQKNETVQTDAQKKDTDTETNNEHFNKLLQGITAQLATLTSAVQQGNIRNADGAGAASESVDDIVQGMFK